jgi:hydroxyacylglutathione hydrolase
MIVETIKTGQWKQNCFVIYDETKKAVIVDPGDNAEDIDHLIVEKKLTPVAVFNTHAHFDHVGAVEFFKKKYSIPFFLHGKEVQLLKRANLYKMALIGSGGITIPTVDFSINNDHAHLKIEHYEFIIHQTPGHTNGSICIEIDGKLFVGDTLLNSSLIPKNLPEENQSILKNSLTYLKDLNPELMVMPGHGSPEKLGLRMKEIFNELGERE